MVRSKRRRAKHQKVFGNLQIVEHMNCLAAQVKEAKGGCTLGGGRVLQLDNFIKLKGYGWPNFKKMNLWKQDKGQNACAAAFLNAIETGAATPISAEEIFEVARVTIEATQQLRNQ